MRDARVDKMNLQRVPVDLQARRLSQGVGVAHGNANLVVGKRSPDDAGLGLETKSLFIGPESAGEPRKATSSIPAHFRLAAIGVVIAHPEVRPLRRWLNSENPVSTHTTMPVAKPCNAGSIQGKLDRPDCRA